MIFKIIIKAYWIWIIALAIISCPTPETKEKIIEKIPEDEILIEVEQNLQEKPLYAFKLLKRVVSPQYRIERIKALLKIYINQREYTRALALIDSIKDEVDLKNDPDLKDLYLRVFLNEKKWEDIVNLTDDRLLKGIALYNLQRYDEALEFFSGDNILGDFQSLYRARCYYKLNDFQNALNTCLKIDSISSVLLKDYQILLFDLLLNSADISLIKKEIPKIKDSVERKFLRLKIYEWEKDRVNFRKLALDLIKNNPSSSGAKYCITVLKPKNTIEYKEFGKVAFLHKDYSLALKFFNKGVKDRDVNYYLGKIYYDQQEYGLALNHFCKTNRADAYYYRGLIYEYRQDYRSAINAYDSLIEKYKDSNYATKALKRRAFLMEDIGDTLGAAATFIKTKDKMAIFRAGFQLFRIGQLSKALDIFANYKDPDFIYWQIRIKERLNEPTDSLKNYLFRNYPLSYYTLLMLKGNVPVDTTYLDDWLKQLGDSTATFDHKDSLHIIKALRYFSLGESNYAFAELEAIEEKSFADLIFLSKLCSENGFDYGAIKFCIELKKRLENKSDTRFYPLEYLRLLYPARYLFSIMENSNDVWLILAIIWQESMFKPDAISRADARGLMQIIPGTGKLIAKELGVSEYSLFDRQISIRFGTHYFKNVFNEFNSVPLALAAYNAGPINLRKWLKKNSNAEMDEFIELIPFSETRDYVRLTLARQMIYKKIWEDLTE